MGVKAVGDGVRVSMVIKVSGDVEESVGRPVYSSRSIRCPMSERAIVRLVIRDEGNAAMRR